MKFGYFTLSDNRYPGNTRSAETLVREIYEQALHAEAVGLDSAWIGEHHFNLLGVNASPHMLLAQLAGATSRIRLAPAVVLLPVHHPLQVAEDWATLDLLSGGRVDFAAGRGYDRLEYGPFGAPFEDSAEAFAEGLDIVWRAWTETGPFSHDGRFWRFDNVDVRPKPAQKPLRPHVACFSRPSMELAARRDWHVVYAPFAAAMVYGSLAEAVAIYRRTCEDDHARPPRRAVCSYFIHIADTPTEDLRGREALVRYFQDALLAAFPGDPATAPPSYRYFVEICRLLREMSPDKLTNRSVLIGPPAQIIEDLKLVEAAGIDEVVLYFNYGLKPHEEVKDQMTRFTEEVAPHFR